MYGKNDELFRRVFGPARFTQDEIDHWSLEKERRYQEAYKPHLRLIDGLEKFLKKAHGEKIALGIGTAAIPFNLDFVLDNLKLRDLFGAIVTADDVKISKPDPEVYLACAERLRAQPQQCLVFEDAPKGVEAALNAGMKAVVVLSTLHGPDEFKKYPNVVKMIHNYTEVTLEALLIAMS